MNISISNHWYRYKLTKAHLHPEIWSSDIRRPPTWVSFHNQWVTFITRTWHNPLRFRQSQNPTFLLSVRVRYLHTDIYEDTGDRRCNSLSWSVRKRPLRDPWDLAPCIKKVELRKHSEGHFGTRLLNRLTPLGISRIEI